MNTTNNIFRSHFSVVVQHDNGQPDDVLPFNTAEEAANHTRSVLDGKPNGVDGVEVYVYGVKVLSFARRGTRREAEHMAEQAAMGMISVPAELQN